ncbi:MAG: precorrin-6A reductase [Wujia sp.]
MMHLVIFGGTLEGRRLTEVLMEYDIDIHICVATEYGASLLPDKGNVHIHAARLDEKQMEAFLEDIRPDYCVDATHPYAAAVTENIHRACGRLNIPYLRLLRGEEKISAKDQMPDAFPVVYVESVDEAVDYLQRTTGNIFITTGSKELEKYTRIADYRSRCVARVLPAAEVVKKCTDLGFEGKNLICMQGPFSLDMNYEMLRSADATWLVTKSTGRAGGFEEKCEAAIRAGVHIMVIGRPEEPEGNVYTFQEIVDIVSDSSVDKHIVEPEDKVIYLIGTGPGAPGLLTREAALIIEQCDALAGARRMLEIYENYSEKPHLISYKAEEIRNYIDEHPEYDRIAVLFSGDTGFYSGASGWGDTRKRAVYTGQNGITYRLCRISGVASPVYFMDRLGVTWEDAILVSNHGKQVGLIPLIRDNHKVCSLLGDRTMVSEVCRRMVRLGMRDVKVTVGERLSYEDEKITTGYPEALTEGTFDPLSVVLFENPVPRRGMVTAGLTDDCFERGKVPMTKQEVRWLALSYLGLEKDSVIYDVGAGTGSVSVEAALLASAGTVYSIEKNPDAISLLEKNRENYMTDNMIIIEGTAPKALEELPAPTHVFIGGSSGNLMEIIRVIREKNRNVRFVVNAVTLETVMKLSEIAQTFPEYTDMELIQVGISRSRELGHYHMLAAENPIYIAAFGGQQEYGK